MIEKRVTRQCDAIVSTGATRCRGEITYSTASQTRAVERSFRRVDGDLTCVCNLHRTQWDHGEVVCFPGGVYRRGVGYVGPLPEAQRARSEGQKASQRKAATAARIRRDRVIKDHDRVVLDYYLGLSPDACRMPHEAAKELGLKRHHVMGCQTRFADWFFGTVRLRDQGREEWAKARKVRTAS